MEDRRCREVVWGRKGSWMILGTLVTERGETERAVHRKSQEENISPKPLTGKIEGLIFMSFCNQQASKTGVLEVCCMSDIEP